MQTEAVRTNALISEASPYLRQHAHNPVDWLPWSERAFEKARTEDKPVFLSIGYAACHWCHVMEHESFDNASIAAYMNEHFVSVKVDREERPDVDHRYMQAVQSLTGTGGWPLSVFLTPDKKPFFGGTYWPPMSKWGRPGFLDVLKSVAAAWENDQGKILASASEIDVALNELSKIKGRRGELGAVLMKAAINSAVERFDTVYGGFGSAPKFPPALEMDLLLRLGVRQNNEQLVAMVALTLRRMAHGGIYDQIGAGFHRYATEARWILPHFEKMLYDHALLVPVYLDAWLVTDEAEFARVARETVDWTLREMSMPEGGFASSLDADCGHEEGASYVWNPEEIEQALGHDRAVRFCQIYDIGETGNFMSSWSVPNLPRPVEEWAEDYGLDAAELLQELAFDRQTLLAVRNGRVQPARDDKVLTDWNALMISALVRAFAVLGDERHLAAARSTAETLMAPFERTGRLPHSRLGDRISDHQFLLDYAALGSALLDLYLADGEARWFKASVALARKLDQLFESSDGPYQLSADADAGRGTVDPFDAVVPSGVSLAATLMTRLYHLTGDTWYLNCAESQLRPLAGLMAEHPGGFAKALIAVDSLLNPPAQLVLVGDSDRQLWKEAQRMYVPGLITAWVREDGNVPTELAALIEGKVAVDGKPTAYLCRNFVCELPTTSASKLQSELKKAAGTRKS
jgi:uncharacterized protein